MSDTIWAEDALVVVWLLVSILTGCRVGTNKEAQVFTASSRIVLCSDVK